MFNLNNLFQLLYFMTGAGLAKPAVKLLFRTVLSKSMYVQCSLLRSGEPSYSPNIPGLFRFTLYSVAAELLSC